MPLEPEARDILIGVTTATITTILLKKGLRNAWMRGTLPLAPGQGRVAGPAFTLRFVPAREDLATPASRARTAFRSSANSRSRPVELSRLRPSTSRFVALRSVAS